MITLQLTQGSPGWLAHRRQYRNASDTPVVLGISPYKSRAQLLHELHTGVEPERTDFAEGILASGHAYEALARPLAEAELGEDLYPCVGVDGCWSASFDGLTMAQDVQWEHKRMNDSLRGRLGHTPQLPEHYRAQMEHQLMVSGAEKCLFTASDWGPGGVLVDIDHCWYVPDQSLRDRIITAWDQFERDLKAYAPPSAAPAVIAKPMDRLPALLIQISGSVTASNLPAYRDAAIEAFRSIPTDLQTDDDFAEAEQAVKFCSDVETRIEAAKQHALSQTASIDALFAALDSISAEARTKRLSLGKIVEARKTAIKTEIVEAACTSVRDHIAAINATLGKHAIDAPGSLRQDVGAAIKGLRTVSSIRAATDKAAADAKISASQDAERVRAAVAVVAEFAEHASLVPDAVSLCASKSADDLRNLLSARVAEHKRLEAERAAKAIEAQRLAEVAPPAPPAPQPAASFSTPATQPQPSAPEVRINLGQINARIWPLQICADGLSRLGFLPIARAGASKLYLGSQLPAMIREMIRHLESVKE